MPGLPRKTATRAEDSEAGGVYREALATAPEGAATKQVKKALEELRVKVAGEVKPTLKAVKGKAGGSKNGGGLLSRGFLSGRG